MKKMFILNRIETVDNSTLSQNATLSQVPECVSTNKEFLKAYLEVDKYPDEEIVWTGLNNDTAQLNDHTYIIQEVPVI